MFHPANIPIRVSTHNAELMASHGLNSYKRGASGGCRLTFYFHSELLRKTSWKCGTKLLLELDKSVRPMLGRFRPFDRSDRALRGTGGHKMAWQAPYLGDLLVFPAEQGMRLTIVEIKKDEGVVFEIPAPTAKPEPTRKP